MTEQHVVNSICSSSYQKKIGYVGIEANKKKENVLGISYTDRAVIIIRTYNLMFLCLPGMFLLSRGRISRLRKIVDGTEEVSARVVARSYL